MINLPVINRLDILNYGLFPGKKDNPGLHISTLPGLTLVLGANGLGKTTLVTILYRMLTGPYDISSLAGTGELGTRSLRATAIANKGIFSQRVVNGARSASCHLEFTVGSHSVSIDRGLKDLKLAAFQIDGINQAADEESFQIRISDLVGVWSFGDWILLLRHIIFYFEERRALVWDPTAQRQLLRILFLPLELARRWSEEERTILELDSRVRNLRAALFKETIASEAANRKVKGAGDVLAAMTALEERRQTEAARRTTLDEKVAELESSRQDARLRLLKAEQERESRYRQLERARLMAIEARFPERSESARYILAQLLSSSECLFCGKKVPDAVRQLETRISAHQCIICGSDISNDLKPGDYQTADSLISKFVTELEAIEPDLREAKAALQEAEVEHGALIREMTGLDASIAKLSVQLEELARRLPPDEADLLKQQKDLLTLQGRVEVMLANLTTLRSAFKEFVQNESRTLVAKAQDVQERFNRYARGFLFEECGLTWSPNRATLGQGGETIAFPGYKVELGGTNFPSPVRRSNPDQVSESQREFIDLAFRMALMETAATDGVGTLVIDAPESSLDAVFSKRAAEVLALFAKPGKKNRLIATSNVVDSSLIPLLIKLTKEGKAKESIVVDLFEIAEPTRATREMQNEYKDAMDTILNRADPGQPQVSEANT